MSTTQSERVHRFAAAVVHTRLAPTMATLLEDGAFGDQWQRFVRHRLRRLPDYQRASVLDDKQAQARYDEVHNALAASERAAFLAYVDSEGLRHSVQQAAAFDLGLAIGRAFGGSR